MALFRSLFFSAGTGMTTTTTRSGSGILIATPLLLLLLLGAQTAGAATAAASIFPGTATWAYHGCYNETTVVNGTGGLRALDGVSYATDSMTVSSCLNLCGASGEYAFAGVEYTRECYCSKYISSLSAKLPDSACNLACQGNASQACGGSLALTVYQTKSSKEGSGITIVREAPTGSALALGIAMGVSLYLA